MTREEAIKELSCIADEMPSMECANWIEAISMAIEALEQESCDDAISREAAICLVDELKDDLPDDDRLSYMVMSHNEGILEYQTKLSLLPSVTPVEKVGRWIPVSERLPKTRDEVLIFLANGQITIASYNDHFLPFFNKPIGWGVDAKRFVFDFCSNDVIAWMPLPEPYKAESEVEE